MYFYISPKCSAPNCAPLFLTAKPDSLEVVVDLLVPPNYHTQHWELLETNMKDSSFILLNRATQKVIYSPKNNSKVCLIDKPAKESRFRWNHHGADFNQYTAIELNADTHMNLNVSGNGPYKPGTFVLAYSWSHSAINEIWTIKQAQ